MALAPIVKELAQRTALGVLRREKGVTDLDSLARFLRDTYKGQTDATLRDFRRAADQAQRSYFAARDVEADPMATLARSRLGVDPSIRADEPTYRYRVVVVAAPRGRTGEVSTAIDINSDVTLSFAEVSEMAIERVRNLLIDTPKSRAERRSLQESELTVHVISAGRRG